MHLNQPIEFHIILDGYNQAYERFLEAYSAARTIGDQNRLYIPLLETLGWADVIEERVTNVKGPSWVKDLPVRFHNSEGIILGYRYVRNIVHHDWVLAIELDDEPGMLRDWRWRRGLVAPKKQTRNQFAYSKKIAGRALRHTFKDLHSLYKAVSSSM